MDERHDLESLKKELQRLELEVLPLIRRAYKEIRRLDPVKRFLYIIQFVDDENDNRNHILYLREIVSSFFNSAVVDDVYKPYKVEVYNQGKLERSTFYHSDEKELILELEELSSLIVNEVEQFYFCLNEVLPFTILRIYEIYSLEKLYKLKLHKKPILTSDKELFWISPLLFKIEDWQELVAYELSMDNKENYSEKKEKLSALLKDLSFRFNSHTIPFFQEANPVLNENHIDNAKLLERIEGKENVIAVLPSVSNEISKKVFDISVYIDFIDSHSFNEIKLLKPKKKVVLYLAYLLKKSNDDYLNKELIEFSEIIVNSIFEGKKGKLNKTINFTNLALADFVIFLAKEGFIKLYKKRAILPEMFSNKNLPLKIKGTSHSNMKNIFIDKLRLASIEEEGEDYSKIELDFDGLTSELALKKRYKYIDA